MRSRRAVGLATLWLLAVAVEASAQASDPEGGSGVDYAHWRIVLCPRPNPGQLLSETCFGDETEERRNRMMVRSSSRWVQAGALMLGHMQAGLEFVKSQYQRAQGIVAEVAVRAEGFGQPIRGAALVRIAASDTLDRRIIETHLNTLTRYRAANGGERFDVLGLLATGALARAQDAQAEATALADQALALQARLTGGRVDVLALGSGAAPALLAAGPPPPPADADPATISAEQRQLAALERAFAGSGQSTSPSASAAPVGPAWSVGAASVSAAPDAPRPSAAAGGAAATGDLVQCAPEKEELPLVAYQRATVQTKAAEAAAAATTAEVEGQHAQVRATRAREREYQRSWRVLLYLWSLRMI